MASRFARLWPVVIGTILGLVGVAYAQITLKTGPTFGGDGTTPTARATRTGGLVVTQQSGKYAEAVLRGNCYVAAIPPGTGQAPGTALGTTAALVVWNPLNSGKNLRMLSCSLGYISGTLGAGTVVHAIKADNSATVPTGGTAITPINLSVGSANTSVAKPGFGQTLVSTPVMAESLVSLFAELATTANGMQQVQQDLDGRYIITPGNGISLQGIAAAGTAPLITASYAWEEVTIGQE